MESSNPVLSSAIHALTMEMKRLHKEPVEGFSFKLVDDNNIFIWEVAIFGPPDTLYEGGYFKALMQFPPDYPYSPPTFRFLCEMWHPNIYTNGAVCISILHPPVNDPHSGEEPSERWNPTQNVRTVLLSIISLLNEPNTMSPANVDASVAFRQWKDGIDNAYECLVRQQVLDTQAEAEKDGVTVPTTVTEYCVSHGLEASQSSDDVEYECFDPDYDYCDHDEDEIDIENE